MRATEVVFIYHVIKHRQDYKKYGIINAIREMYGEIEEYKKSY